MSSEHLPNYLRAHRKWSALSQDEVAFILDCQSSKTVSRYERYDRQPSLETALRFEALFGIGLREVFAGMFEQGEKIVVRNMQLLFEKLRAAPRDPRTARKIRVLGSFLEKKRHVLVGPRR